MTHSQIPQALRRKATSGGAHARPTDDPELRRMLASHIHCGEPMQLVSVDPALPDEGFVERNGGALLTYRCACGFSFDQRPG